MTLHALSTFSRYISNIIILLFCLPLCCSGLHCSEGPEIHRMPSLDRAGIDPENLRRQIQFMLDSSRAAKDSGRWIEALTLAHKAELADSVLQVLGKSSTGAGEVATRYQAHLIAHDGKQYMNLISTPELPRPVRLQMVALLEIGTGSPLIIDFSKMPPEIRRTINNIKGTRSRIERQVLDQGASDEIVEELADTFLQESNIYLEIGRPDLAYNALMDGYDREGELGRSGSDALLSFNVGSFFMNYLPQHLDSVRLILFSEKVSEQRKRALLPVLREAVLNDDFPRKEGN